MPAKDAGLGRALTATVPGRALAGFLGDLFPGPLLMLAVRGFNAMEDAIRDFYPRTLNRIRGGRATQDPCAVSLQS
jgi:hypothetical protein